MVACTVTLATISEGDGTVKNVAAGRMAPTGVGVVFHLRMRDVKIWIWLFVAVAGSDVHSYGGFRAFLVQLSTEFISRRGPVGKLAT
jgi:hypothetical protein